MSSTRKVTNSVQDYMETSDKKIDPSMYFILKISFSSEKTLESLVKKLLSSKFDHTQYTSCMIKPPIVAYLFNHFEGTKFVYLVFSCLENEQHMFDGSHHQICSYFSSIFALHFECCVSCQIIELDSRLKIIAFFQCLLYENSLNKVASIINDSKKMFSAKTSAEELELLTFDEYCKLLNEATEKDNSWETLRKNEEFGSFITLKMSEKDPSSGKYVFSRKMDTITSSNIDDFYKYFFE